MFQKILARAGLSLLAGAVLLMTPDSSWAQHGHFGGGHFGGAHFGGYHGGYHSGYGHYHPYYDHHRYYGHYPYFGYGYYPYDGYTGYGSDYTEVAPPDLDVSTLVTPPAADYRSYYAPVTGTEQPDDIAHVTANVPPDANVWFGDTLMTSTGSVRHYDSPPLAPGSRYTYDVKASWNENGHTITQTQKVEVAAGAHVSVDFPAPPKTAEHTSTGTHS